MKNFTGGTWQVAEMWQMAGSRQEFEVCKMVSDKYLRNDICEMINQPEVA